MYVSGVHMPVISRWVRNSSWGTCNEHVLFNSHRAHPKEGIVDMLADDVDSAWCACDVGRRVAEEGVKVLCELIVAMPEGMRCCSLEQLARDDEEKYDVRFASCDGCNRVRVLDRSEDRDGLMCCHGLCCGQTFDGSG